MEVGNGSEIGRVLIESTRVRDREDREDQKSLVNIQKVGYLPSADLFSIISIAYTSSPDRY